MTNSDLTVRLSKKLGTTLKSASETADAVTEVFREAMLNGEDIKLVKLFTIYQRQVQPKKFYNIHLKQLSVSKPHYHIKLRVQKELKNEIAARQESK